MARLESMAKMGYYPTPQELIPTIVRYLKPKNEGSIRIFDPCAGEGTALNTIGEHLQAETYGIEIDKKRGKEAQKKLTKCLITDYKATQITPKFASILWLNPPYDWATRREDLETSERYERTFLRDTLKYLIPGGILVYLIPLARLDRTIARMLSYRFDNIRIYKFPENLYRQFRQIVLFGVLKRSPSSEEKVYEYLKDAGTGDIVIPYLPETPKCFYEVPPSPITKKFLFRSLRINPHELEEEINLYGLNGEIRKMNTTYSLPEKMTSIMPLRHGHLAQLIACGSIKGVVFDKDQKNPLVVKGITKKTVDYRIEKEGNTEKQIETDRIVVTINAIDRQGNIISIQERSEPYASQNQMPGN
jgi:tRNA1(Val) A37 N6-methylase TrmN6